MLLRLLASCGLVFCLICLSQSVAQTLPGKEEVLTKKDEDRRDYTNLKRINVSTWVHEPTDLLISIPKDWKEIRASRMPRKIDARPLTTVGVEHKDWEYHAIVYIAPMSATAKLEDFVRVGITDKPTDYGEEYATLVAIYGASKLEKPIEHRIGSIPAYKIPINDGPLGTGSSLGALYVFTAGSGENRWLVRVRVNLTTKSADKKKDGDKIGEVPSQAKCDLIVSEVITGFDTSKKRAN
jgi:hypothetical protein